MGFTRQVITIPKSSPFPDMDNTILAYGAGMVLLSLAATTYSHIPYLQCHHPCLSLSMSIDLRKRHVFLNPTKILSRCLLRNIGYLQIPTYSSEIARSTICMYIYPYIYIHILYIHICISVSPCGKNRFGFGSVCHAIYHHLPIWGDPSFASSNWEFGTSRAPFSPAFGAVLLAMHIKK